MLQLFSNSPSFLCIRLFALADPPQQGIYHTVLMTLRSCRGKTTMMSMVSCFVNDHVLATVLATECRVYFNRNRPRARPSTLQKALSQVSSRNVLGDSPALGAFSWKIIKTGGGDSSRDHGILAF